MYVYLEKNCLILNQKFIIIKKRRRGLVSKTVALAAEGRRFESTVW